METGQATIDPREWISSRRTMVPQHPRRGRNRFALLPRFGSHANLFLPVKDDATAVCGGDAFANSSLLPQKYIVPPSRMHRFFSERMIQRFERVYHLFILDMS